MVGRENDMPNERYEADGVPERLRQITIETLPVERPYVIDIEPFVEPQEVMYTDKTQDRLFIPAANAAALNAPWPLYQSGCSPTCS